MPGNRNYLYIMLSLTLAAAAVRISAFVSPLTESPDCPLEALPSLYNGRYLVSNQSKSVLYFCDEGFRFETRPDRPLVPIFFCDRSGRWQGELGKCVQSTCTTNPCINGGLCSATEDPFAIGYTCHCPKNYGGKQCQIADPCRTCPPNALCQVTNADDSGRFCYSGEMKLLS